jgi:hypothetical protein
MPSSLSGVAAGRLRSAALPRLRDGDAEAVEERVGVRFDLDGP